MTVDPNRLVKTVSFREAMNDYDTYLNDLSSTNSHVITIDDHIQVIINDCMRSSKSYDDCRQGLFDKIDIALSKTIIKSIIES